MIYAFDIEATVQAEQRALADLKAEALAACLDEKQRATILALCSCDRVVAEATRVTLTLLETSQDREFSAAVLGYALGNIIRNAMAVTDRRALAIAMQRAINGEADHSAELKITTFSQTGRA